MLSIICFESICSFIINKTEVQNTLTHNQCIDCVCLSSTRNFNINTIFTLLANYWRSKTKSIDTARKVINSISHCFFLYFCTVISSY